MTMENDNNTVAGVENLSTNEKFLAISAYSLIALISLGGNGIAAFVILRFRIMHTPTNILIGEWNWKSFSYFLHILNNDLVSDIRNCCFALGLIIISCNRWLL